MLLLSQTADCGGLLLLYERGPAKNDLTNALPNERGRLQKPRALCSLASSYWDPLCGVSVARTPPEFAYRMSRRDLRANGTRAVFPFQPALFPSSSQQPY